MAAFDWDRRCETGIASIDAQHQELFRLARELYEASKTGAEREVVTAVLKHLITYCNTHFQDEEAHMERLGFPGLQAQQEEHRKLTTRVYGLLDQHATGQLQVSEELSILVFQWLRKHIKEYDQVFADFVRTKAAETP